MATNDYSAIFQEAARAHNVDPLLLRAAVQVESSGNPNAVSEVGAQGLGQLMPKTAKALGVKNAFDPRENIFGAAKLLDENLTRYGNPEDAILAYHGGTDQKNWGPKTHEHLGKVKAEYQKLQGSKMPSTVNTIGEMGANDDAFTAYFSGKSQPAAAPTVSDPFAAYFGNAPAAPTGQAGPAASQSFVVGKPSGLVTAGNIDLNARPVIKNKDGSISTVRSMSVNFGDGEVLIPTVAADGSRILSNKEAIDQYKRTGQHLGIFKTPEEASAYSENLHNAQASQYVKSPQGQPVPGAFTMGVGDVVKGGVQSLVHGIGALAERYPNAAKALNFLTGGDINADVAADFRQGIPQVDTQIAQQERAYQAQRPADAGIDLARLGGSVVGAAPLAAVTPSAVGDSLLGRAAVGAGAGALGSLASPVTDETKPFAQQKMEQAALGAALGGAAPVVTSAIGGAVRGVTDPVRQRLAAAGVTMTPGQILGGALQRTEDKLTSVPVLGDFIKGAQRRSLDSFNRATYNSALEPLGTAIPDNVATGSAAVNHVRRTIGDVYQGIQPRANFVADQNFAADLAAVRNELSQNAPGALAQFDNIVQNQITAKLRNNAMNGDQWGNTRSTITRIARDRLIGNSTPDDRVLASALDDLGDAVNAAVGRASPPDVLPTLGRANAAWAQYKQIERAAGSVGASNNANVFTAAQFASAVRKGSTNAQKATNSGMNAQFAGDAADVLGAKYPDSGTVGRSLLTLGTGALAGQTVAPGVVLPAAAAIGVGSLPYTAPGQRLAQALLMNRPAGAQAAGNAIANMGPRLGALLAPSMLLKP